MKKIRVAKEFWIILFAVFIIAAILAILDKSGRILQAWIAYTILLGLGAASIFGVWKAVSASRKATVIAITAFALRLAIGVTFTLILPLVGYQDNEEHQAGYIYTDAYIRDNQAWSLAVSGENLGDAFTGIYPGDQYGGMLALSALIYRFLSPDAHRPFLILILGAVSSACGVLCLWKATQSWFGEKTASLATWFFALYPESVLLGSSQMREAIIIPLMAMTLMGFTEIQGGKKSGWFWMALSAVILLPIQPLVSFISFIVLFGVWFFDPTTLQSLKKRKTIFTIVILISLSLIGMFIASSILAKLPSVRGSGLLGNYLTWFQNNFTFQSYLLELSSGIYQGLLNQVGEQWRWLIILVYGIAQPVLPAIVGDPSAAWIMRIIGFLRAAGWYALALFLIYGMISVIRSRQDNRRYQLIWIGIINWVWIMVSALNAGADQWDNPRYRAILLLWQVIMAAWALEWSRAYKDAWLWRWLTVEVVFVALFTEWYIGRYYPGIIHLDILQMGIVVAVICGAILIGWIIWDYRHKIKPSTKNSGL